MKDTNNVSYESAEHTLYMVKSRLARTLLAGTQAMRDKMTEYLPQNRFETETNYNNRVKRSFLFNAFKHTGQFLAGQVFQKPVAFTDDHKDTYTNWSLNIDRKGNNLDVFAKRLFFNGITKGVSHILVEMPNKAPATTKQDEIDKGIRPFLKEINPEDILGWFDEFGDLLQVRIKGVKTVKEGRFGTKDYKTVLVLEPGSWELFISDDKGSFGGIPDESGTTNLSYIPLITYIPGDELTLLTGISPLDDLTWLNLKHWQSYSDQGNILHTVRAAFLFFKMIDLKELPIGTQAAINSNDKNADAKYVEHSGKGIEAGRQDLEDNKSEMALYGLQQLVPGTVQRTATDKVLTSSESNSNLATWAIEFEDVLDAALRIMSDYMGIIVEGEIVTLNKEFSLGMDATTLDIILKSVTLDVASRKLAFDELKRRGVYSNPDTTWEDVLDEIEEERRVGTTAAGIAANTLT